MIANWMNFAAVLALAVVGGGSANAEAVAWQADYGQALAETRSEERPLVVVLDDPACQDQRVDDQLLQGEESADLLAKYERCHVDVSTEYGRSVAKAFGVQSFPHVAIIDRTGKTILHRHGGQLVGNVWRSTLERFASGRVRESYVVAKPIVNESEFAVSSDPVAQPVNYAEPVSQPSESFTMPSTSYSPQPFCARCQRGY